MDLKSLNGRLETRRHQQTALKAIAGGMIAFGLASSAHAGTITAAADTFVRDGSYASTNYGSANPLEAKTEVPSYNRDAYLKFDISGQGAASSAILSFYATTDTSGATIKTNVLGVADTGWSETGMTWNNRPALGSQIASFSASGTAYTKISVDVTNYVKAQQAAGKSAVSFALHNASSSNIRLFMKSREDASKPTLTITASTSATPTPSPTATPVPPSSTPVPVGAGSSGDAFVRDGSYAGTNYGGANPLEVKTESTDWNRDAYMKFDTSGTSSVNTAVLTFYAATDTDGASVNTDIYAVSNSSWSESGLTWGNRPALGSVLGRVTATGTAVVKYTVDLSNYVKSEKAAGRNVVSIALHNAGASNVRLLVRSREDASYKPVLSLNGAVTAPTPTPTPVPPANSPTPAPTATPGPSGNHYYVSTSGSDSNPGTQSAPWRTINKAVNTVRGGGSVSQIIHVAPGTYNESVVIPQSFSGTSSTRTYLVSDTKWGANIRGSSDAAVMIKANYVDFQGFDVSGTARIGIHNDPSIGYIRVIGNRVHDILATGCSSSGGAGILADYWSGGKYIDIIGNFVYNIGPSSCNTVQGIYYSTTGGKIQNNVVGRVAAWGIHMWHEATNLTITNNIVFNAASGGIVVGAGESSVTAVNCHVHNNIVRDTPYGIIEYGQLGSGNSYSNNLLYNTPTPTRISSAPVSGTITADPQFVNYQSNGSGNYRLNSTSPAVNKGTTSYAPSNDFDGVARPQGGAIDIGAFER